MRKSARWQQMLVAAVVLRTWKVGSMAPEVSQHVVADMPEMKSSVTIIWSMTILDREERTSKADNA
jgi:hypothetical protein